MIAGSDLRRSVYEHLAGNVEGALVVLDEPLSYWGGLSPSSGCVVDANHPQYGECVSDKVLVIPGVRGSTAGSGAVLEIMSAGIGPRAFILTRPDVCTLIGLLAFQELTGTTVPLVELAAGDSLGLYSGRWVKIANGEILLQE
jgi:predicted aconitase with swiveling domain